MLARRIDIVFASNFPIAVLINEGGDGPHSQFVITWNSVTRYIIYFQTNTTESTTRLLLNDILNVLLCVAQLLPSICTNGSDLAGLDTKHQTRDVRDVHAKCNELFKCFVYRGAELHFIHQVSYSRRAIGYCRKLCVIYDNGENVFKLI